MNIVAIAWMYVILMMSITESSVVAGVLTFVLYGLLPVSVILYLMDTPRRRRRRLAQEEAERQQAEQTQGNEEMNVAEGSQASASVSQRGDDARQG